MRFQFPELHGFEDVQKNFEQLEGVLNQPQGLALSFLQLKSAQNYQVAIGSGTLAWPGASATSNFSVIAHGLGRTPVFFAAFAQGTATGPTEFWMTSQAAPTTTNITVNGHATGAVAAGSSGSFLWLAIG